MRQRHRGPRPRVPHLVVGFTYVRRGNAQGAQLLLRRAADRIATCDPAPYGIATALAAVSRMG
ncbi:hypothetical protein OG417_00765 [Actinoallomurus sp. NBC_01490]|uniref:hypothetical protein n=1 Tax=Actinoallomurus sp. NBC_01490 TaxID=2903557 RepID=UPI002E2FC675|nr:hypothetical protein [Actinoallomurus sp. NBC_01490]